MKAVEPVHMFFVTPHEHAACGVNLTKAIVVAEPDSVTCKGCIEKLIAMGLLHGGKQ